MFPKNGGGEGEESLFVEGVWRLSLRFRQKGVIVVNDQSVLDV